MDLFSESMRRDPFPVFERLRSTSPVFRVPESDLWMVLDYEAVQRVLVDHDHFRSDLSHVPG
jgi:cytochrome P450